MHRFTCTATALVATLAVAPGLPALAGDDPWADEIVAYDAGANPAPAYTNPATALGAPERYTGEGIFPSVVSPFSPPFGIDEIVSIGAGGSLVLRFFMPVTDHPANPGGIDLLIFGNTGFIDVAFPSGVVGGTFGNDGGTIEVSDDCERWVPVPLATPDGLLPTLGWLDSGPYDADPGTVPSDFTRPGPSGVRLGDLLGLSHEELVLLYDGSGGGAGIDLAGTGLAAITCVRITNPGEPATTPAIEIDAVSDVAPDPGSIPGDLDGDGAVGTTDLLALLGSWGGCGSKRCPGDIDGDGAVGIGDLLILLAAWTA